MTRQGTLNDLKASAAESATNRGHTLGPWDDEAVDCHTHAALPSLPVHRRAKAACTNCGREVWVNTHPAPNGIDVHGEVVAIGCTIDTIEHAFARFGPRMKGWLKDVRECVNGTGITGGEIWEAVDDEWGYELAWPALGLKIVLADAAEYEGVEEGEERLLINVMVDAIEQGGAIVIDYVPNNYTPDVWVDLRNEYAVEELERRLAPILAEGSARKTAGAILPMLRKAQAIAKGEQVD